jgi:ankyrin repeat protein
MNGHLDIVKSLVAAGCPIDVYDAKGYSPLWYAAHEAFPSIVELLIQKGASATKYDGSLLDAVLDSSHHNNTANRLRCLGLITDPIASELDMMLRKIRNDAFNESLIGIASALASKILKAVDMIISRKMISSYLDIMLNSLKEYPNILKWLRQCIKSSPLGPKESPLIVAINANRIDSIQPLIQSGLVLVDDTAKDTGKSALYVACERGFKECIDILLELGADVSLCTSSGRNSLHAAVERDHADVVERLTQVCTVSDMIRQNTSGVSPLNLAANRGRTRILKAMLNAYRILVLTKSLDPQNQVDPYVTQLLQRYSHLLEKSK